MTGAVWLRVRGLFPCLHQEGVEAYSLPLAGVGSLVLSVTMEVWEKSQLAAFQSWLPGATGGFCVEGISWSIKIKCAEEQVQLPPAPVPDSWKCTQVLSNVEKPHFGCADKKIIVKELCLYDDVARQDAGGHHLGLRRCFYQGLPGVCGVRDHKAKLEEPLF